jgi:preprotein translocase subunit SecD
MKPVTGRLALLAVIIIVSLVMFLPSTPLFSKMPDWWKNYFPAKGITLGLDLQGGIHLVLEVEADRAVEIAVDRASSRRRSSRWSPSRTQPRLRSRSAWRPRRPKTASSN